MGSSSHSDGEYTPPFDDENSGDDGALLSLTAEASNGRQLSPDDYYIDEVEYIDPEEADWNIQSGNNLSTSDFDRDYLNNFHPAYLDEHQPEHRNFVQSQQMTMDRVNQESDHAYEGDSDYASDQASEYKDSDYDSDPMDIDQIDSDAGSDSVSAGSQIGGIGRPESSDSISALHSLIHLLVAKLSIFRISLFHSNQCPLFFLAGKLLTHTL